LSLTGDDRPVRDRGADAAADPRTGGDVHHGARPARGPHAGDGRGDRTGARQLRARRRGGGRFVCPAGLVGAGLLGRQVRRRGISDLPGYPDAAQARRGQGRGGDQRHNRAAGVPPRRGRQCPQSQGGHLLPGVRPAVPAPRARRSRLPGADPRPALRAARHPDRRGLWRHGRAAWRLAARAAGGPAAHPDGQRDHLHCSRRAGGHRQRRSAPNLRGGDAMNDGQLAAARRLLDALCDAERLAVAGRLAERSWSVTELARELGIRPQGVMRHLTALESAGLIFRDGGRPEQFWLDAESLRSQAAELRPDEADAFTDEAEDAAKILRAFIVGERLTHLPVQRSRRLVVLRWLADHFEPGRIYQESEINELLGQFNDDYALLRRELVDEGFMARDHGVYWLSEGSVSSL